jgi:glycosyltransferase involved in cell wall biosynthesis
MRDALWFRTRRVEVVANGIPDPCPDFDEVILPRRRARLAARRACAEGRADADPEARTLRVLYLAHCTREKGVFDALEGVLLANERLRASGSAMRVHLTVAGAFFIDEEEREFRERLAAAGAQVSYAGFVSGEEKARLLRESDAFCFPTYYPAEGQPVSLIEAMACGLAIVTTRWRAIPELLPPDHPGFVPPRSPEEIATALLRAATLDAAAEMRAHFLAAYTEARHVECLRAALLGADVMPAAA